MKLTPRQALDYLLDGAILVLDSGARIRMDHDLTILYWSEMFGQWQIAYDQMPEYLDHVEEVA